MVKELDIGMRVGDVGFLWAVSRIGETCWGVSREEISGCFEHHVAYIKVRGEEN